MSSFKRATRKRIKARVALVGPTGSGKTYTALSLAKTLGDSIAVIDSENGSASRYFGMRLAGHERPLEFDVCELQKDFSPRNYVARIAEAEAAGYDVLIIDSLSHAWAGTEGALDMVDKARAKAKGDNSFTAWRHVTPEHNKLVDALVGCSCHLIVTMRTKTEYVIETVNGKSVPRKVGLTPVQRDGIEYEFDVVGEMDAEHELVITKTRCQDLDGFREVRPGPQFGTRLRAWLDDGEVVAPAVEPTPAASESLVDQIRQAIFDRVCNGQKPSNAGQVEACKAFCRDVSGGFNKPDEIPAEKLAEVLEAITSAD